MFAVVASVVAMAQGSDDFSTLSPNNSYLSGTTAGGWAYENAAIQNSGNSEIFGEAVAVCINGKTSAVGKITSPIIEGGIGTLTLNYAYIFSESKGVSFNVSILQGGTEVFSQNVVNESLEKSTADAETIEANISGNDLQIVITNNCPSSSTSNKDRYSIWSISWTAYSGGGELSYPLTVTTQTGGSLINDYSGIHIAGEVINIEVMEDNPTMYVFKGWVEERYNYDTLELVQADTISRDISFSYTMPPYQVTLTAVFVESGTYDPTGPGDPSGENETAYMNLTAQLGELSIARDDITVSVQETENTRLEAVSQYTTLTNRAATYGDKYEERLTSINMTLDSIASGLNDVSFAVNDTYNTLSNEIEMGHANMTLAEDQATISAAIATALNTTFPEANLSVASLNMRTSDMTLAINDLNMEMDNYDMMSETLGNKVMELSTGITMSQEKKMQTTTNFENMQPMALEAITSAGNYGDTYAGDISALQDTLNAISTDLESITYHDYTEDVEMARNAYKVDEAYDVLMEEMTAYSDTIISINARLDDLDIRIANAQAAATNLMSQLQGNEMWVTQLNEKAGEVETAVIQSQENKSMTEANYTSLQTSADAVILRAKDYDDVFAADTVDLRNTIDGIRADLDAIVYRNYQDTIATVVMENKVEERYDALMTEMQTYMDTDVPEINTQLTNLEERITTAFTNVNMLDEAITSYIATLTNNVVVDNELVISPSFNFEGTPVITIENGGALKIEAGALSAGLLSLESVVLNTNLAEGSYAQICSQEDEGLVYINSNLSMRVYTQAYTWYFISLPFDCELSSTKNESYAQFVVRYYDGQSRADNNAVGYAWKNYNLASDIIPQGTGFIFQTNQDSWTEFYATSSTRTRPFSNTLFTQTLAQNECSNLANHGWNLIGNPYASYYSTSEFNFTSAITVWEDGTYKAYSPTDDAYMLRPYQAFFVQCPREASPMIDYMATGRQTIAENTKNSETLVNYSFDDAENPALTIGSKATADYTHDSPFSDGKFLNIWGANDNNGETPIVITSEDVTTNGQWTLEFDWAGYSGCNKKAGFTKLYDAEGNAMFTISDIADWNSTMTLSLPEGGTIDVVPCNKSTRLSSDTGSALTLAYWHHFTFTGTANGVSMTIEKYVQGEQIIKEVIWDNVKVSSTNFSPVKIGLKPGSCGAVAIDNLKFVVETGGSAKGRVAKNPRRKLINLSLRNDDHEDVTRVVLNEEATADYELECDASKFMSLNSEMQQLYTIGTGGTKYAINERPMADGTVQLGVHTPVAGVYTLALTRNDAENILLTDKETGITVDLSAENYEFYAESGTNNRRFVLSLKPEATGISEIANDAESVPANGAEYFTLDGRRVNGTPAKGVYLQRVGQTVKKVLVK